MILKRGAVVLVGLEPTLGKEQQGIRPCVVISDSSVAANQKYPMVCIVPITSTAGQGALYPKLASGSGGLRTLSYALVDQLRSVDKQRISKIYGVISAPELRGIEEGIRLYLSL